MGVVSIAVIPTALNFTSEKTKDVLTIYNQNDFKVKFKIMSTVQDGFDLSVYRGELEPESRLDIAVRAKRAVLHSTEPPKIRIEYVSAIDRKARQFKDILVTVSVPTAPPEKPKKHRRVSVTEEGRDTNGSYYLFIVAICLAVLADSEYLPVFTQSHKLIASYVLGMMTILLIKLA